MKYTPEQLSKAKEEGLALVKIEIDYRYQKDKDHQVKQTQTWGAAEKDIVDDLRSILRRMA